MSPIEYRWAAGQIGRIQQYAEELVALKPDVILANSTAVIGALQKLTKTIPIVGALVNDPVGLGFVASLARPGGNITGFTFIDPELIGKWMELLKQVAPSINRAALVFNPKTAPFYYNFVRGPAATRPSIELGTMAVGTMEELRAAIDDQDRNPGGSIIIGPDNPGDRGAVATTQAAGHFRLPTVRDRRRVDVVWSRYHGHLPALGLVYRSHPQRREPGGSAGPAADEIRTVRESEERAGARPHRASDTAGARRRGDRVSAPGKAGAIQPVEVRPK
jgi:hypothetical protein